MSAVDGHDHYAVPDVGDAPPGKMLCTDCRRAGDFSQADIDRAIADAKARGIGAPLIIPLCGPCLAARTAKNQEAARV